MTRDPLDEAVDALRASVQQPEDSGAACWQAIETSLGGSGVAAGAAWKLPFAVATSGVVVAGVVAWLSLSPARKPTESTAVDSTPAEPVPTAAPTVPHPTLREPGVQVPEAPSPAREVVRRSRDTERAEIPLREPRRERPRATKSTEAKEAPRRGEAASTRHEAPAATPEPPPATPGLDPAQSRQRFHAVHRMQFSAPAVQVLEAWDRFLRDRPTPALAVEARYHRGVLLQRMGREEEARAALVPFARGDHGPRRQASAQRLLGE